MEYAAVDLRERDILISAGSLLPVPRSKAQGYRISHRRACAYTPHKVGEKQFDSRSSDPYWVGSTRSMTWVLSKVRLLTTRTTPPRMA